MIIYTNIGKHHVSRRSLAFFAVCLAFSFGWGVAVGIAYSLPSIARDGYLETYKTRQVLAQLKAEQAKVNELASVMASGKCAIGGN